MGKTHFIWDELSDNVLMETDELGAVQAEYTQEPGLYGSVVSQNRGSDTSYYHFDGTGSTRQLTDENQNVTDTATYTAFGEEVEKTGATENPWGYKGALGYYVAEQSPKGLYVRARHLATDVGRWLSRDPLGVVISWYEYASNSPVDIDDASGLVSIRRIYKPDIIYTRHPWVVEFNINARARTRIENTQTKCWCRCFSYGSPEPPLINTFFYALSCQAGLQTTIYIDTKIIKKRHYSLDGTYGHEITHVDCARRRFESMVSQVSREFNESHYEDKKDCERAGNEIVSIIRRGIDRIALDEDNHDSDCSPQKNTDVLGFNAPNPSGRRR